VCRNHACHLAQDTGPDSEKAITSRPRPHTHTLDTSTVQVGQKIDVPFFDTHGQRTIETHELNKRNQKAKEKRFCNGIIKRGLAQSARGDPIFVHSKQRALPHLAITFGSLSNAFYMAAAKSRCQNVLHATQKGLEGVTMLHEDSPPSVIRWVVNFFNEFFDGAEASIIDKMKEAAEVQTLWRVYKKERNLTVSSIGGQTKYSAEYKTWQQKHHKSAFKKWLWFDHARSLLNDLQSMDIYDSFCEFAEENVDFLEPSMKTWTTLAILKEMVALLKPFEKHCGDDKLLFRSLMLEALKFCLPLAGEDYNDDDDSANVGRRAAAAGGYVWQFKAPSKPDSAKMAWLLWDMQQSQVVKRGSVWAHVLHCS
jgi:hypothetical protein